jgi:hypothetical protein
MLMRALFLGLLLALSGCGKSLTTLVNAQFPPITVDQQRQSAIDTSADALTALAAPNLALGLVFSDVNKVVLTDDLKQAGVKKLNVSGDKQLVKIEADFDRQFDAADGGKSEDLVAALGTLKPAISGSVVLYAGLTGAVANSDSGTSVLNVRVLPALSTVKVDKLTVAGKFDETKAVDALVSLLTRYKDNISGELSRNPMTSVVVPALASKPYDLSGPIQIKGTGLKGVAVVSAHPITAPFKLDGIAWLVANDHLTALVQLTPVALTAPPLPTKIGHTYENIENRMKEIVTGVLEVPSADTQTWVAVKKDVVSYAANTLSAQAGACVTATVDAQAQHISQKIPMPNGAGIDCSTTRSCDPPRHCTFNANHDTRDCSACFLSAFGRCQVHGNDPTCEAGKKFQNTIYDADANLRKADCDRLNATDVASCQAQVAGEVALCKTKKQALDALGHTGNFANLDVDARVATSNMNICLRDFALSPGLDHLQFALNVEGSAAAHIDLKFVPLDAGHIVCAADWSKSQDFTASLRDSRIGISANSVVITDANGTHADFTVDKLDIKAKLSPGPTEFLLKSPELLIKCPLLAFTAPTLITLTPFIPALQGNIDYSVPEQKASFQLPMTSQKVAGHEVVVTVTQTKLALVGAVTSIKDEATKAVRAPPPAVVATAARS